MIEIKGLSVDFSDKSVLKDINLKIEDNKVTVIAGQSGSGKTVMMKVVERLIKPVSGQVIIDGRNIFDLNKAELTEMRKRISMLFQHAALFDSFTVYQNIALPLYEHSNLSETEIKDKVRIALMEVGLEGIEDKMPAELSGGMKKRVGLARAIVLNPQYIILDEPTTGLDPIISEEIISLILKLQNQYDLTAIAITHDINFIEKVAEKVILISRGEIEFLGTKNEFFKSEKVFVNRFLENYKVKT